ncbi:response regulator transcription factor [Flavobacterium sp.]|uniref:response regulator transcription factor n=1 Tax=Flavobacterium sp. TaxID=239 RepID=UPI00262198D7|nr:response regulator transcription factor [Flavobacterium sp.]
MKKLLLAEDDFDLSNVLIQYLQLHNFEVIWAENGRKALELFQKNTFDICILDVMMPEMDGFTLAEELLKINPETPFIFLTAKQLKEDKIKGLQLGADDYIVKPFEVEELILRLNNILKRSESNLKVSFQEITIGKYLFDTKRLCLKIDDKTQQLTEKEASLIQFLYQHKNQIVKRETILKAVWKTDDYFSGRSMDVFITKIRKYFNDDANISIESTRFIGLEFKIKE